MGISKYAADALGDVVYAQLPEPGDTLAAGDVKQDLYNSLNCENYLSHFEFYIRSKTRQKLHFIIQIKRLNFIDNDNEIPRSVVPWSL